MAREPTVGRVIANQREEQKVTVQPYAGAWSMVRVVLRPLFQTPEGLTTTPGPIAAKESARYEALVAQVEQLTGGELSYGSARCLSDRGWGLLLDEGEGLAFLTQVARPSLTAPDLLQLRVPDGGVGQQWTWLAESTGHLTPREWLTPRERQQLAEPPRVITELGTALETLCLLTCGRVVRIAEAALQAMMYGQDANVLHLGRQSYGASCN